MNTTTFTVPTRILQVALLAVVAAISLIGMGRVTNVLTGERVTVE